VLAGDVSGNVYASVPLDATGNYTFWVYTDPYKAQITKNDGSEVEEDVYEAHVIGQLLAGKKAEIADGHCLRINGEKYMHLRVLPSEVYKAVIGEDSFNVTIDEVHVLKKGKTQVFLGSKGGYFFMVKSEAGGGVGGGAAELNAMAIGFYYAVGPDA
jgi:hypothetical protein